MVCFDQPSCGPVTTEESRFFMDFVHDCESGKFSSLVRWVIVLGNVLRSESGDARNFELKGIIQSSKVGAPPEISPAGQYMTFLLWRRYASRIYTLQ